MRLSSKLLCEMLNVFVIGYWISILKHGWDLSLFVWLISCISLLNGKVNDFTSFYKNLTDQFSNVEMLRNTFDNIPKMKNDNSKNRFKYKKWNIEIKNIFFSYWEWKSVFNNFSLNLNWNTKSKWYIIRDNHNK